MKPSVGLKKITDSPLLSYVYFNPLFRATRNVRKKLRRYLGAKSRPALFKAAV
jgi:hypothetical protein